MALGRTGETPVPRHNATGSFNGHRAVDVSKSRTADRGADEKPACRAELKAARELLARLDDELAAPDTPRLADRIVARVRRRQMASRLVWAGTAAAAAACLLIALIVWSARPSRDDSTVRLAGCRIAAVGQARFEVLGPRRVKLLSGEVFLDVEPRTDRFVVETPAGQATALGTRFYVKTRPAKGETEMKSSYLTTVLVVSGLVQLANPQGTAAAGPGEVVTALEGSAPEKHVADLAKRFGKYYTPVRTKVAPRVPRCALPLDLAKVANFNAVAQKLNLKGDEPLLRRNAFMVMPLPRGFDEPDDIVATYESLKSLGVPIFVTADTLLHLYHVQFDETLRDVEEREFFGDVLSLSRLIAAEAGKAHAAGTGEMKDAAQLLHAYAVTGTALLEGLGEAAMADEAAEILKTLSAWRLGTSATRAQERYCTDHAATLEAVLSGKSYVHLDWPEIVAQVKKDLKAFIEQHKKADGIIPATVGREVRAELALIAAHKGFAPSPLFTYVEDYSQYVPRGHYTRSTRLRRYFQTMMWYGRMTFILRGGHPYGPGNEPFLVSRETARKQTLAASMLTRILNKGKLPDGRPARALWERIYAVTAFYVGLADDLGPQEYAAAMRGAFGPAAGPANLIEKGSMFDLQRELAKFRTPAIYGGTGQQMVADGRADPDALLKMLHKTAGLRLMGQRFVPDSYAMGRLVYPAVGRPNGKPDMFTASRGQEGYLRGFPRGLDVMALLGSQRARQILTELRDDDYGSRRQGANLRYDVVFNDLKAEFDDISETDWNRNAYWAWLHALKPLMANFGKGYPAFMTTRPWRDRSVTTALASWTQLRHDTILYAKQSYAATDGGKMPARPVSGYVEPVPEFYARMLALTRMTRKGLADMNVTTKPALKRLQVLEDIIARVLAVAEKELAHKPLSDDDAKFIRNLGERLKYIAASSGPDRDWQRLDQIKEAMRTAIVADVHTDQNSSKVLEEGTGWVDLIVVCYLQPDGRLVLGAGPVLSYYEFKQPMSSRLTDQTWRDMLRRGRAPARPEWTRSYLRQ